MFFKNAIFFQITCPADAVVKELRQKIPDHPFTPIEENELASTGFMPLGDQDDVLFLEQGQAFLFRVRHQARQIPPKAVAEMLDQKVKEIEDTQGRKVYRKERLTLKDDIIQEHLPKAMPVSKTFEAYVDLELNLVIVNAGSKGPAEWLLNAIRGVIESFPVLIPVVSISAQATMTKWLLENAPENFTPRNTCKLVEPGDGGAVITVKHDDLKGEGIQTLLNEGKRVDSMEVVWDDQVKFTLVDPHCLKRIKFSDELIQGADQEDELSRADADLALMANTFQELIPDLGTAFGGWLEQDHLPLGDQA